MPVITLDAGGRVIRVTLNNRSAGPLNLPAAELLAYYKAWAAIDALANSAQFVVSLKLLPGQLAVWHNGRVMHGRNAFAGGGRLRRSRPFGSRLAQIRPALGSWP